MSAYQVDERRVLVPQRVEPDRQTHEAARPSTPAHKQGGFSRAGVEGFVDSIDRAPAEHQPTLRRLAEWADEVQREGLATVSTYWGKRGEGTLLPRLQPDNAGLVTIWNWMGSPMLSFWRTVFERRAPQSLVEVERRIAPQKVGQGNTTQTITEDLLEAVKAAYQEAGRAER